jgi:hypothetical protein
MQEPNFLGFAVTMPFKAAILPYLDELTPACRAIGACNTISIRPGTAGKISSEKVFIGVCDFQTFRIQPSCHFSLYYIINPNFMSLRIIRIAPESKLRYPTVY